ncbi:hypothetical protein JTB14_012931 [Gonioctena quinquepunctata]|nr:hypothetical protein JTB14_012931 [Gonioctena quinquepunctata]
METTTKKIQELRITVSWGYIAAKAWGEEKDPLVLCIHGIMDNAGTFDRLIPYLPNSFYYVAIDLPGHGLSSHFPPHLPIHSLNYLLVYKHIAKHFGKKFIVLGHSYGGQLGFLFAQLHPECVEKIIMLDTITLFPVDAKNFKDYLAEKLNDFVHMEEKFSGKQAPIYTYEEAFNRLQNGRNYSALTSEAAKALLTRAIVETDDGRYRFSLDQRIKSTINVTRDFRYVMDTMKSDPVNCPILIILGKESKAQRVYMRSMIQFFQKWKNVTLKMVGGGHDVHNEYPERVVPYIVKFLVIHKGKL